MAHFDGKRKRGGHTTCTDLSRRVIDLVLRVDGSTVSPGLIETGKGQAGGSQKVKIGDVQGGILLTVRQARSVQRLTVFSSNCALAKLQIARALRDDRIPISFSRE